MSNNETKLRAALTELHDAAEDARNLLAGARPPITRDEAIQNLTEKERNARQVLKETAPEPPKHPAVIAWNKYVTWDKWIGKPNNPCKSSYMQGFKDALLWAAEQTYNKTPVPELNLSTRQAQFLKETANTVPQ